MDYVAEKGCKNGQALWPLRTAVSGKQMPPGGAYEIMELLGKDESLARTQSIEPLQGSVRAAFAVAFLLPKLFTLILHNGGFRFYITCLRLVL